MASKRKSEPGQRQELHPARRRELKKLAKRLGHEFKDLHLLERALCHSSTGNEGKDNYERLEFLGDAVLGFMVAEKLYHRTPEIPVGQLTDARARIVSRPPLAAVATDFGLGELLVGGRGLREEERLSPRILADLTESVLGAIFLDGGVRAARKFVRAHILNHVELAATASKAKRDPKSRLLHKTQTSQLGQPVYRVLRTHGPDHQRTFEVAVEIAGRRLAVGHGRTKQQAEMMAAERALEKLESGDQESA